MELRMPTYSEIDELIRFLPKLYAEEFQVVIEPRNAISKKKCVIEISPPVYNQLVSEFFKAASKDVWCDAEYLFKGVKEMLQNPVFIEAASLAEVQSMLTHCVRGERFCFGHWQSVIEGGQVRLILMRLQALRLT